MAGVNVDNKSSVLTKSKQHDQMCVERLSRAVTEEILASWRLHEYSC